MRWENNATPEAKSDFVPIVSVTGELVPAQWATVSTKVGGQVTEVLVEAGTRVREGSAVVRLDTTDLELALQIAQQEVVAQQAALDQLLAGTSERTIARAERENTQQIQQAEVLPRIKERQVKLYGDGAQVRALDGVSLQITAGEFVSVMGPSGSGKSTLLNMLGALDRPTSGQVLIEGQDLGQVKNLDGFRAQTVGFVFQLHNLIPTLTSRENVEVPMRGQPISARARRKRAQELLELVNLAGRMNHLPNQLSGGERQRVAIARSLANRPKLVLADEPTGNLDSHSGGEIIALMRKLNHELGTTFIVVTHDEAVARQTDRILVMQDGQIVRQHIVGSPFEEDLKMFRDSGVGQALLSGEKEGLETLSVEEQRILKQVLERASSNHVT